MNNTVERPAVDLAAVQRGLAGPDWLVELRTQARKKFDSLEWPTTSEEEWRRTNLSPFEFDIYHLVSPEDAEDGTETADEAVDGSGSRIVYKNGSLQTLSVSSAAEAAGITISDLGDLTDTRILQSVRDALTAHLESADNRMVAWHLALLNGVAVIAIPAGAVLSEPIYVDVRFSGDEAVAAPHLVILAGRDSEATVVRRVAGADEGEVLVVDGSDLLVEDNARLKYVAAQFLNEESLYFANDRGIVERDGVLKRTEAALGSDFVKTRFDCVMNGAGSDAILNGIYFAADEQHMDIRTVQHHLGRNSTSRSYYRGAVRDESHAIYQGLIQVAGSAPGTDAFLTNKNLILGEGARADSIPSLNIKTDDVRCSHGSTTGKLDPAQVFYLQSRGFRDDEARRMLIEGFFDDLIRDLPQGVSEQMRTRIANRVPE